MESNPKLIHIFEEARDQSLFEIQWGGGQCRSAGIYVVKYKANKCSEDWKALNESIVITNERTERQTKYFIQVRFAAEKKGALYSYIATNVQKIVEKKLRDFFLIN